MIYLLCLWVAALFEISIIIILYFYYKSNVTNPPIDNTNNS